MIENNTNIIEANPVGDNADKSIGTLKASKRGCKPDPTLHKVNYLFVSPDGTQIKITQHMTQAALGRLLLDGGVKLLDVNHDPATCYSRKKK